MSKHKLVFKIIALVTIQIFIFTTSASAYPTLSGLSKAKKELRVPARAEDPAELVESLGGNVIAQFPEDLIELKKGPYNQNWWEVAVLEELSKNPTPWGDDPIVPVETEKGVIKGRITREMLGDWSETNPAGRNILSSFKKYEGLGPISIAGIRHTMNIANVHDTRQVKNSFERFLTSLSLGLMIKILYNKGAGFPYQVNYGHEVRYHSDIFQNITVRQLAAMGFICHVVPNNETIAIWDSSTMGKVFDFVLSFCGTASHAESNIDGLKIMDYEGSQFLTSSIEAMIAIQGAIIEKIENDGYIERYLSAENDPRITDQLYKVTDYGLDVYKKYQEAATCDKLILDMVKTLDPTKIHIDCAHGAAYRTLPRFLEKEGLGDLVKQIDWMHIEERSDFGNIGKLMENLKTGEDEIFDLGADGTQMYEKIMPNGKIIKYFPVLCTADYPDRFAEMPVGDIILHTDMDHDHLYVTQILANDEETKNLLAEIGVVYNVINSDKVAAVFIPNKFFHLLHEMNFMRLTTLMEQGKVDKNRTLVVLKTLASTPAVDKWVEKRKEEGCNIVVINTAVGFAKLANVMYRAESQMREHPGDDVIVYDASGKEINIGSDPLILAAWEESGGIITGVTYGFKDLLGNSFLASREKSATESIFLSLALISKLQKEKREVDLAAYLKELYIRDKIDTPIDLRFDNKLFVPGTTKEANEEEEAGNQRKNRIFGAYLSIVIAYMKDDINIKQARDILRDIFEQEYQARKEQSKNPLAGVLIERFKNVDIDSLIDIKFTGDGVMFIFEKEDRQWFVLFRPSGTEPKLKSYGFGEDTERLTVDAWVFAFNENIAGSLPQRFTKNKMLMELWGKDGTKAVEKARRMQNTWEEFGLVVDPEDLTDNEQAKLENRKLVRRFSPPDNHLEMINQWLENEGLSTIDINLNSPQAMPQEAIVALLEAIPEPIYKKLGRTKQEVISKEKEKRYALDKHNLSEVEKEAGKAMEQISKEGILEALTLMSGKEKADLEKLKAERPELKIAVDKFAKIGFDGDNARLGWFGAVKWVLENPESLGELSDLIEEKRKAGAKNFIFCGMGGSVLCVDTVRGTFKEIEGLPVIQTLSDTDPDGVRAVIDFARRNDPNLRNTYVVVTSKSGTTAETLSHLEVWERVLTEAKVKLEDKVIILTDSGSPPYETSFWQKRAEKLKRAYAEIEIAPYINNPKILTIQLDEGTDIGGRFTAPATRLFLLAAGLRGKNLEDLVQRAAELSEISEPKDNPFIELGVIFYSLAQKGIDQITLILPDELKEIAPWAEQLFEESLGKDDKGLHIVYGEKPDLTAYKDVDVNDRIFLRFKIAGEKDRNETFIRQLKEKGYPLIEQEMKDDLDITKVMYGLGETVATIAYLWDINFVDQPAVVLYKSKTKEYAKKDRSEIVNNLKARKDKKVFQNTGITVYYGHLLEQGIVNQAALESELDKLGRNLENASAEEVTAAIMRIVMAEEDIKCIDTRYYGYDKEIRPVLEDWRNVVKRIFRRATKVSKGPDINHSGEQNAVAGLKGLRLINVAVPEKARRLSFGEFSYDDKLLIASALGTVDAQTEAGRPALLVTLPDTGKTEITSLDKFYKEVAKKIVLSSFAEAFPHINVKLNKEKLTEGPMAFIIDPALIGDNPSLALAIQNLKDQLGDKVRIVLQHSRKSEKLGAEALYEAIKKATEGTVDLKGKVDWAAPAKASPEEIIKEVQKRFENVGSIRVVGRQEWTKGFEGIERPGLEKITLLVCKIGEGSKVVQGDFAVLLALKNTGVLPEKEMIELNKRWGKGETFFIVETKEIAEEMEYIEKYQEALKKFE